MDQKVVENILSVLKNSSDKNIIHKGLVKIRTDLVKDRAGVLLFKEAGGITPMVRFLHKPHEKVLEVVLSILGNCCTNIDCCNEAMECKIIVPLSIILKSIPNPVIQSRACRLLGNLAKEKCGTLVATYSSTIVKLVCTIMEESTDNQTRVMILRACRYLLSDSQFIMQFLISKGLFTIFQLLPTVLKINPSADASSSSQIETKTANSKNSQHREKYFTEVSNIINGVRSDICEPEAGTYSYTETVGYVMPADKLELELVNEILKCLLIISQFLLKNQISADFGRRNTNHLFSSLVFFASETSPYRSTALTILWNFSKNNRSVIAEISLADAVIVACELLVGNDLRKENSLTDIEIRHCIDLIAVLSEDSCNRAKIRRSGALKKLLTIAKTAKNVQLNAILWVFTNFQYDNLSMDLMLKEGLHSLLISELNEFIKFYRRNCEEKCLSKKRDYPIIQPSEIPRKSVKLEQESFIDSDSPYSSPRSNNSPSSPCSSRSMSPINYNIFKLVSDGEDSETYSPVCSDGEDEGIDSDSRETNKEKLESDSSSEIMKLLDIACKSSEESIIENEDDEDAINQDTQFQKSVVVGKPTFNTIELLDRLIFRVTFLLKKRGNELGKPETLCSIIQAINTFGVENSFGNSLSIILSERQIFAQMIIQGIPHKLYQMTKCDKLKKSGFYFIDALRHVGESNYGVAELLRLLKSSDSVCLKRAAIGVAYLIKSEPLLIKFLNDCCTLTTILSCILDSEKNDYSEEAADALTAMSVNTLLISTPKVVEDINSYGIYRENENELNESHENSMRFVLQEPKNKTIVPFSKDLLCKSSVVFNSMLNSDFKEGKKGEIHLNNFTESGIRYFINLIVRLSNNDKPSIPTAVNFGLLLEAFDMARTYIIPKMEELTFQIIIKMLDTTNCQTIFEWSIKNCHPELTEIAIKYYLCSDISAMAKIELFKKAYRSKYSSEWRQTLCDAIVYQCGSSSLSESNNLISC